MLVTHPSIDFVELVFELFEESVVPQFSPEVSSGFEGGAAGQVGLDFLMDSGGHSVLEVEQSSSCDVSCVVWE